MRSALFWYLSPRNTWPLKIGSIGCPETSVRNWHSTRRKIPEERRSLRKFGDPGIWKRVFIKKVKVKWYSYRPGVTQRVGRGIALLFHDRDTRKGWVVSSTPRPHFTPGEDPVPILQEAGWAPGPVWTGGKSRPHRDSIADRQARSPSLYRLSYPTHRMFLYRPKFKMASSSIQVKGFIPWVNLSNSRSRHLCLYSSKQYSRQAC